MLNFIIQFIKNLFGIHPRVCPTGFLCGPEQPCDNVFVIDDSGSMNEHDIFPSRLYAAQQANKTFVQTRAGLCAADRVAVIAFNRKAQTVLPFTWIQDTEQIFQAIDQISAGGGTCLEAGLKKAGSLFTANRAGHGPRGQRILLLTDGHGGNPVNVAAALKRAGVLIEVIGIGGNPSEVNESVLKKVATTDDTGLTHYWFIQDAGAIDQKYRDIATGIMVKGKTYESG